MPATIATPKPTVDLIQSLYLQGLAYQQIADQVNVKRDTIRQIVNRNGWVTLRDESKAIVVRTQSAPPETQAASGRIRAKLVETIEADMEKAAKQRPSLKRQERLEPLVRNAKVALGWGEEHTQVLVNISALNPTDPGNAPIDVSSVATALPLAEPAQPGAGSTEPVKEEPQQPVQLPHD